MTAGGGPPLRVALTGPQPQRIGGVASLVQAVRAHARGAEVSWVPVGRRRPADGLAPLRDLRSIRHLRRTHDLLHLNPSLRSRALIRDLTLLVRWGGPAVVWIHGWDRRLEALLRSEPLAGDLLRTVLRRARCCALAPAFRDRLLTLGLPADRVEVLPPCWVGSPLPREEAERPHLLYLGRLVAGKGIGRLIRASAQLGEVRVVLAGVGPLAQPACRLGDELGVEVELAGWLSGEAKWRALARATAVVLPSDAEGVPVSLIEAMAAGTPVIASRVGGIGWLLEEGEAGCLLDRWDTLTLAQALQRLLADDAGRARRAERGRARAAGLTAPEVVASLEGIWRRALA